MAARMIRDFSPSGLAMDSLPFQQVYPRRVGRQAGVRGKEAVGEETVAVLPEGVVVLSATTPLQWRQPIGMEAEQMDQPSTPSRTCPKCGSGNYAFRQRKQIEA